MSEKFPFSVKLLKDFAQRNKGQRASAMDEQQRGLRVDLRGDRLTFYLYRRIAGRPARVRIGPFPELSIDNARKRAAELIGRVASGENVVAERRADRHQKTIAGLWAHWLAYAQKHKTTWREDERRYKAHLEKWANRRLKDVSNAEVESLHTKIGGDRGPYEANRVLALVRAMFNAAPKIGYHGANPCRGIKQYPEDKRERFLQPDEIPRLFAALENEPLKDFFLLCLFVGQRRSNVQAMRWDEIDLNAGRWTLIQKGGGSLTVPLSDVAMRILNARERISPWVFPSNRSRSGHLMEPKGVWARVIKAAGITDVRPHDLRRTLGSWQAVGNVSELIIGKSLGHAPGSSATAIYARLHLDPVRKAVNDAGEAMMKAGKKRAKKSRE